jgi:hypothetical protein
MLIRNIIMALVAFFVLGTAAPALAKTNGETIACRDAGFAALPFTGTVAQKEAYARNLAIGTEVLVDGITVKLDAGQSLWSRCKTGPSALEVATAKVTMLEAENARLRALAYTRTSKGPVSWKSVAADRAGQITDLNGKLDTAKADAEMEAAFGMLWLSLGLLVLAALAIMIMAFSRLWDDHVRLQRRFDASKPAPATEPIGSEPDERPTYAPGQP